MHQVFMSNICFVLGAVTLMGTSPELSQRCAVYAIPLLCHYAFPQCDNSGIIAVPKQICRDECEALEKSLCKTEYIMAKATTEIGTSFDKYDFIRMFEKKKSKIYTVSLFIFAGLNFVNFASE